MNAAEKILKAKVQLILEEPFFATLALRMQYMPDTTVKTASTNGKNVTYNPGYVDQLSIEELKGVIAHEVMHVAMLHHTRRDNRDSGRWNQATDYAINPLLIASGFVLPESYLINEAYQDKSAEQIYGLLPPPQDQQSSGGKAGGKDSTDGSAASGGTGDVEDAPTDTGIQETENEIKQTLAQAALIAKRQGKLPAHLERLVNDVLQPKIDWREALARFLAEVTKNDYTWKKPAVRYLHAGLYLPALESEETGKVILILDTSCSINETILNQFAGEIQDIANTFAIPLQVIYVDTEVQSVQDIDRDEPVQLKPMGGGGTDFRPGFAWIELNDMQPKAVVYMTDGFCNRFPAVPDYPVLWALFDDVTFTPPFGEVLQVS